MARVSQDSLDTKKALEEGEEMLSDDCIFFNCLHFCRHAIEACLEEAWWDEAAHYCGVLENHTSSRPTSFARFFIARGRALAALRGERGDETTLREIRHLHEVAERARLRAALPALEKALSVA